VRDKEMQMCKCPSLSLHSSIHERQRQQHTPRSKHARTSREGKKKDRINIEHTSATIVKLARRHAKNAGDRQPGLHTPARRELDARCDQTTTTIKHIQDRESAYIDYTTITTTIYLYILLATTTITTILLQVHRNNSHLTEDSR